MFADNVFQTRRVLRYISLKFVTQDPVVNEAPVVRGIGIEDPATIYMMTLAPEAGTSGRDK